MAKKIHMTESQVNYCLKMINEEPQIDPRVIYTAQVVVNPHELVEKYPNNLPNKYYGHSTNKFGKQPYDEREGEKMRLHIIGRLTNDVVDTLVVENPNSTNPIAHITLGTAEGIKPFESNNQLQLHRDEIQPLNDYVDTYLHNYLRQ